MDPLTPRCDNACMRVLIVGGAGFVASIIRPAMEAEYDCRYFDLKPVPDAADRTTIGDVNDDATITRAIEGVDSVIYMAMGRQGTDRSIIDHWNPNYLTVTFDVNVKGAYRVMARSLAAGIRRFCYVSSLSVYRYKAQRDRVDESTPADDWRPYGLSKRIGEFICAAAVQEYPDASIVALRLNLPVNQADWDNLQSRARRDPYRFVTGPRDLSSLFVAAAKCSTPGCHIIQSSGDVDGEKFPCGRAAEILGWRPQGG